MIDIYVSNFEAINCSSMSMILILRLTLPLQVLILLRESYVWIYVDMTDSDTRYGGARDLFVSFWV